MIKYVRQTAMAAGLVALSLASSATWAASVTYDFKTFFDTSTADPLDTKQFGTSIASLTLKDITGGVELTLTQNKNAFPEKFGGTFVDALYLNGPKGTFKLDSNDQYMALFSGGYSSTQFTKDGYKFNWNIDFGGNSFSEGESAKMTIKGTGVTVAAFKSVPMLDLDNVGKPYATGFLSLNDNVHFLGSTAGTPAIPEPGTYALLGLGLVGISFVARRRDAA
jgi:hypothetical protein